MQGGGSGGSSNNNNNHNNAQIIPALRRLTTIIPKIAIKEGVDASSQAAGLLSRLLAASNIDIPQRRVLLVHITNMLAWTYFKLHRLHSLPTALKAVIPLEDSLESLYSMPDCSTYRYWRARALLSEWKVDAAFKHFEKAYSLCYVHAHNNRRRIASYWFTTALILRRSPSYLALERNNLSWPFVLLFTHARKGDAKALYAALDQPSTRAFFVRMGVYTMLKEKMECVVHRGLLRRTLHTYMLLKKSPNPIIPLNVLVKTLQQAHPDEDFDVDDAEAVAVSLIDQGFIGASIQHSSRTLVFAKSDQSAFPEAKGGNPEIVRESQRRRYASVELVDEVMQLYNNWNAVNFELQQLNQQINQTQKAITQKKKAKEDADGELAAKKELDGKIPQLKQQVVAAEAAMKSKAAQIGNIVGDAVPIHDDEDNNVVVRTWHPDGPNASVEKKVGCLAHHEVLMRLDGFDLERGQKIAGHRGYFLQDTAVDLNLALISYGLDFLRQRKYNKVMTPFMMRKDMMSKTAQLEDFDEELYKIDDGGEDDKYLIATSEQPISAMFANEWFESPKEQLPIRLAGYSTCFRKEAGKHGKDTWGIFRVHQFEKVEQFCVTSPEKSWEVFDEMVLNSEEFYKSLGIPYRLVNIVSGALNNAAAQKYDLEAWFPYLGEWKELVSTSNCTDYQSRSLEVRHGIKKQGETKKTYVHMLNGTMCATERAMCCIVENWQNEEGFVVPPPLRRYMQDREFIPFCKDLPKAKVNKSKK
ncbi:hypothetical protein E3P99_02853 [Wallemia hederae]|uniref:serine--tRNA ligase n=1 Tax=Wallemia hederae TaxID=1540922 RepID=A0A4T0FI08_9BASI|nr:hypothetical protein E3P99_02853 [Wallemia hederae]